MIGVKCDFPPFGFIDVRGSHDGYDVQVARRFASLAFGSKNKVEFTCVTTPSRIPALQSSQVDIIISTLTWTQARNGVDRLLHAVLLGDGTPARSEQLVDHRGSATSPARRS